MNNPKHITTNDIAKCRHHILNADHYNDDGTCKCKPKPEPTTNPEPAYEVTGEMRAHFERVWDEAHYGKR